MMTYPALPLLQFPLLFQSSAPFLLLFNQIALKEKSLFFFPFFTPPSRRSFVHISSACFNVLRGMGARVATPSPGLPF